MSEEIEIKFMRSDADETNLADDPKLALLATCIVSQQAAGFKDAKGNPVADLREALCPQCSAPGFNTGWGYWKYICGAEICSDGEESVPCEKTAAGSHGKQRTSRRTKEPEQQTRPLVL